VCVHVCVCVLVCVCVCVTVRACVHGSEYVPQCAVCAGASPSARCALRCVPVRAAPLGGRAALCRGRAAWARPCRTRARLGVDQRVIRPCGLRRRLALRPDRAFLLLRYSRTVVRPVGLRGIRTVNLRRT
jgi:hypothetical protein